MVAAAIPAAVGAVRLPGNFVQQGGRAQGIPPLSPQLCRMKLNRKDAKAQRKTIIIDLCKSVQSVDYFLSID